MAIAPLSNDELRHSLLNCFYRSKQTLSRTSRTHSYLNMLNSLSVQNETTASLTCSNVAAVLLVVFTNTVTRFITPLRNA